jgi:UDP-glucose 4-epimerase
MANILVTGGAGYVGSVCTADLVALGHRVTVLDDLSAGHRHAVHPNAAFYHGDLGDSHLLNHIVDTHAIEAVFHFAAKALIPESVINPAPFFGVNVVSAYSMLEVLRAKNVRKFIFSSTAAVYGTPEKPLIDEDDPKNPVNSYGESKLAFERILASYARAYGFSVVAFRYFNASGATDDLGEDHRPETHIIPLLFDAATGAREHFTIYGENYPTPDGTCVRDYVHVLDIAHAHILALDQMNQPGFSAYNIGTGTSYSVREVRAAVEKVTGLNVPVHIGDRRLGDPPVLRANPAKLIDELGWVPANSDLSNIIATAWRYRQSHSSSPHQSAELERLEGALECDVDV